MEIEFGVEPEGVLEILKELPRLKTPLMFDPKKLLDPIKFFLRINIKP
jgi:hypothetical protein